MAEQRITHYPLRFHLGLCCASALVFWLQFAQPTWSAGCWALLGSLLFLGITYPDRFWAAFTGVFGFEAGILLGLFLGVPQHWLWIGCGFASAVGITLVEFFRLGTIPLPKRPPSQLRAEVLVREIGLGASAGSAAATLLRSELMRLYLLGVLLVFGRILLDQKLQNTRAR